MKTLSRGLSLLALLAWGGLMLYFYFSGRLNQYLIPSYRPLVALSGFLMLGIAGSLLFGIRKGTRWQQAAGLFADDASSETLVPTSRVRTTQVLAFGLLVVPIWAAVGVSNDHFSANAILNRGISTDASHLPIKSPALAAAAPAKASNSNVVEPPLPGATPAAAYNTPLDASQYLKTTPDGHIIAEVTDLLFASDDDSMRPAFEGKTVEMTGQFMPVKNANDGRFQVVRMFMVCCAADARPVAVASLPPTKDAKLPGEMAWTKVIGKVTFPLENGRRVPVIHAESVAACEPPSEAMLY